MIVVHAVPDKPDKSYKMQFKVRLTAEQADGAYGRAKAQGVSFSRYVASLIDRDAGGARS